MKRKASQGNHFSLTITHKFHFLKKYWAYSDVILAQIFNFINCLKKDPTPVLVSWPHQQGTTRAGVSNVDIHFVSILLVKIKQIWFYLKLDKNIFIHNLNIQHNVVTHSTVFISDFIQNPDTPHSQINIRC